MKQTLTTIAILLALSYYSAQAAPREFKNPLKIFNYDGPMPIRDERTGEVTGNNEKNETSELAQQEAACWRLINEQSLVTFALQSKVLDEMMVDIKDLKMDESLRESVNKMTTRLRDDMELAKKALEKDAADEFFDALFDTSEDIISLSSILRDPNLSDEVFLAFVKSISRLGRNNAALIQEFADMCSFVHQAPKPRFSNLQ